MGVNGSKTELMEVNESFFTAPTLNNELCVTKNATKSLGITIYNKLNYKEHSERLREKVKRSWDRISRVGGSKWCLSIPTLLMLYKTIIIPQLMYASPIWFEQNKTIGVKIQQHFIRSVFRHSYTPNSSTCEVLLGLPPLDFYIDEIEIKFLLKTLWKDDFVRTTHLNAKLNYKSKAASLESKLLKCRKFMKDMNLTNYTKDDIETYTQYGWRERWSCSQNNGILSYLLETKPTVNSCSPL